MILSEIKKKKLEKFYPIIGDLSKISGVSMAELLMVIMGDKPAAAESVFFDTDLKNNLNRIKSYAFQVGLSLVTSKYKYIVNSPRGIFEEISLDDSRLGKIILAFAKSKEKARNGADYYHKKMLDSKYGYKFGKLMGYPECCLQFGNYLNNNEEDPNNFGFKNPAIESLKRSKHFDWHLNVFTISLLPHFPCNLTCKKSIAYVDKLLAYLDYIDKGRSIYFRNCLTEPTSLYWTCADKILIYGDFKQYKLGTGEIKYNKIELMITSDTYYQKINKKDVSQWKQIGGMISKGNKLIVTDGLLSIYSGKEKIFEVKKNNKYTPVLIKPDILP